MLETKLSWTHAVMLHMQRVQLNILVQFLDPGHLRGADGTSGTIPVGRLP